LGLAVIFFLKELMYLTKKLLLCHIYHFNFNNCTSFKSFFENLFDEQRNAEALALKETSTYFQQN